MANKQISQLTAKPVPVASTDQFGIDDNSSDSWKITVANLKTFFDGYYLLLSGGTMTGNLILNANPSAALGAATKQYVDSVATGLNIQGSCRLATTGALTVTYDNGTSGVGATLTNAGAQAALNLDGVAAAVDDRILVKDQASALQNGIFTVTDIGSGASNWVMTRATDFDTPTEIQPGDFVLVLSGTANMQTQWVQTATVTTVGVDSIVWDQFGADLSGLIVNIQNEAYVYITDTGAADAYVATLSPAVTAYVAGQRISLKIANANTGASTVNVNNLGAKNIKTPNGNNPLAGDLIAGMIADLRYDGTNYILLNRNHEKRIQNESYNYILDTGAADAYVATLVPAVSAYVAGQRLSLKIANANTTTTPTVNVNGLGAKTIVREASAALAANDMIAGMIADLRYDGTNFILENPMRQILGTATNNNAADGYVGEVISSTVLVGAGVALTSGVASNITSIALTPGDWDVQGSASVNNSGTATVSFFAGISATSATLDDAAYNLNFGGGGTYGTRAGGGVGPRRISLSANTTYYLVANSTFGSGTSTAFGHIYARRAR